MLREPEQNRTVHFELAGQVNQSSADATPAEAATKLRLNNILRNMINLQKQIAAIEAVIPRQVWTQHLYCPLAALLRQPEANQGTEFVFLL